MIDAIFSALSADATLTGLLTGGIIHQRTAPEISRQHTPTSFDGDRNILPTLLLQLSTTSATLSLQRRRASIAIYLYEKWQYTTIEQARERIKCLLHNAFFTTADGLTHRVTLESQSQYLEDEAIDCRLLIDIYAWPEDGLCEGCP